MAMSPEAGLAASSCRSPPFQRCHRLQSRLEALRAGLLELELLRDIHESLVKGAIDLIPSPTINAEDPGDGSVADSVFETEDQTGGNSPCPGGEDGTLQPEPEGGAFKSVRNNIQGQSRNNGGGAKQRESGMTAKGPTAPETGTISASDGWMSPATVVSSASADYLVRYRQGSYRRGDSEGAAEDYFESPTGHRGTLGENAIAGEELKHSMEIMEQSTPRRGTLRRSSSMVTPKSFYNQHLHNSEFQSHDINNADPNIMRRRGIQRSMSLQEPISNSAAKSTESITREEMLRRKRRSVHELDFSFTGQPGLASRCFMGSSRAFRYPSPLHAISLQSPLCLPEPEYEQEPGGRGRIEVLPPDHDSDVDAIPSNNGIQNTEAGWTSTDTNLDAHLKSSEIPEESRIPTKPIPARPLANIQPHEDKYQDRTYLAEAQFRRNSAAIIAVTSQMQNAPRENAGKPVTKADDHFYMIEAGNFESDAACAGNDFGEEKVNTSATIINGFGEKRRECRQLIDARGRYNDGVVRSKAPVSTSLFQASIDGGLRDSEPDNDHTTPQPRRKNAYVSRVEYQV